MPAFPFRLCAVLLLAGAAAGQDRQNQRWFEDVTHKAGIHHRHHVRRFNNPYAEIMQGYTKLGAAVAVADYDRDGFEDIFVTDSCETCKNHLYHNNGDFTFTDVAEKAGVANGNDAENASSGALWFDFNNDGLPDLLVVRFGHPILYQNLGGGKFRDVTKASGLDRYMNAIKAIAFDFDNDGLRDTYVTNITDDYMREGNFLWHNNGILTFTDISRETGTDDTGWGWAGKFFDYDNDGWLDLYVMNGWVSGSSESYVPDIFEMVTKPNIDLADARNSPPIGRKSLR